MPSLVAPSDVSAIGDNVIPQLNTILSATPLPPISKISDITPSLLLDLYELLFRIKLAYATPRDLSPDSQLKNIRVLIGHIAHDILKMDLSFLEPQKICDGDERALGDFLRIFLGVARLRKAHLDRGGYSYQKQVVAGDTGNVNGRRGSASSSNSRRREDERSLDGSEHTIRATPKKETFADMRRKDGGTPTAVRGTEITPRKNVMIVRKTPSKPIIHEDYSPPIYQPSRYTQTPEKNIPHPPASDTSSVPTDFINNVNERVSNIWSRLNSRTNRHISDKISERPSSHSPRRPLSIISQDPSLPSVPENGGGEADVTPIAPIRSRTASDPPSLAEPTPAMKAWLETSGIEETSNSSHKPRSAQTTPEKRPPIKSTQTAPTLRNRSHDFTDDSPIRPDRRHHLSGSNRSKSSTTPPQFALQRRRSTTPSPQPQPNLNIDLERAIFSNSPIRISGHSHQHKHHENSSSEEDEDVVEGDTSSDLGSGTSSIATSALSVSSIEWSDTASIRALRKIRLDALEEIKRAQEEAIALEEEKDAAVALVRRQQEREQQQQHVDETQFESDDDEYEQEGLVYVHKHHHHRRRSSIPSTFMHKARSTVSYQTISPNSSASVAAEKWRARWRNNEGVQHDGSPVARKVVNGIPSKTHPQPHSFDDDDEGSEREEIEEGGSVLTTRNTEDLEAELRVLEGDGLSESKRQIMLFERLIRRAVDKRPPVS
ncbi:hypothetical protein TWF694_002527 [Orbilia ellipsospora]|uniref:DUF5745 domain-containing protein n=1 Tax=Orbilia ellipsospora TaxID=2528407 RepID=A0AAV9X3D3_9PEZI